MSRNKKPTGIVVKRTPTGKFSVKMTALQFERLYDALLVPATTRVEGKQNLNDLTIMLLASVLQVWFSKIKWVVTFGAPKPNRSFTISRAEACAIVMVLTSSKNPYMIELKAALLNAL